MHWKRGERKGKKETDFLTEGTEGTLLTSLMAVLTTPLNPSSEVGLQGRHESTGWLTSLIRTGGPAGKDC